MFDRVYQTLAALGYFEPIHPPLTHMPIALAIAALIFGVLGALFKRANLLRTARDCLILAWFFFFPAALLGYLDWQHFYNGVYLFPFTAKIVLSFILFALLTAGLVLVLRGQAESRTLLLIYFLGVLTAMGLGYFGGRIVYGEKVMAATPEFKAGARLFVSYCSACHAQGGNIVVPEMPLKGSDDLDNFEEFLAFIRDPRLPDGTKGAMPDFPPSTISDQDARVLFDYLGHEFGCPERDDQDHEPHEPQETPSPPGLSTQDLKPEPGQGFLIFREAKTCP